MSEQEREAAIHPASEIKLARARQRGDVCRSSALAQAIQAAAGLVLLSFSIGPLAWALLEWTRDYWANAAGTSCPDLDLGELVVRLGWPLGLMLLGLFVIGCVSHLLQVGWSWGQRPLLHGPQVDFVRGFQQWFSPSRWAVALTGLTCCAGLLSWWWSNGSSELSQLAQLWAAPEEDLVAACIRRIRAGLWPVAGCLLLLGGLDYTLQRWNYYQRMQMTDEELRQEQRDEQNPARSAMKNRRAARVQSQ